MYKLLNSIYNSIRGVGRMKKTYTIIVHKEEEVYWAECPELDGCFAQSNDIDELKGMMKTSIYLYFNDKVDTEYVEEKDEIRLEFSYA